MLRPRKNPLVDGPLIVTPRRHLHAWRWAAAALASILVLGLLLWPRPNGRSDLPNEVWWRQLVSTLAFRQFTQSVNLTTHEELKQRLAQVESERHSLAERLVDAERIVRDDQLGQRLRQVVARRKGRDIAYEILVRTPEGAAPGRLSIEVAAIDLPDPGPSGIQPPTHTLPVGQVAKRDVAAPKVAETFQGALTSAASHVLVVVRPHGKPALAEAAIVPVSGERP